MSVQEAIMLFRRLGVDVPALARREFDAAYHRLAWRYHPDIAPGTHELMANINAARAAILKSYRPG
jgi:DnaJ-class molecular chaperone